MQKTVKIGFLGLRRGACFMRAAMRIKGVEVVAVCDHWEPFMRHQIGEFEAEKPAGHPAIAGYTDYDAMLEQSDLDAVVLCNYFHEHASCAIKALKAGKHVLTECSACLTMAEAVALVEAVEVSGKVYMLAEYYGENLQCMTMRQYYLAGNLGKLKYAESEYIHYETKPDWAGFIGTWRSPGYNHWRNWLPATYYCTHAMAPVMYVTDCRPVSVNGFIVPYDFDGIQRKTVERGDTLGMIVCRMDNGAVVRLLQGNVAGGVRPLRICCAHGRMQPASQGIEVRKQWHALRPGDKQEIMLDYIDPDYDDLIGGKEVFKGDVVTMREFTRAINHNEQPIFDVYASLAMTIVGILAFRSAREGSAPQEVPDLRDPAQRDRYRNDHWSPDPARNPAYRIPSSVLGFIDPTDEAIRIAEKIWEEKRKCYRGEAWQQIDVNGNIVAEHKAGDVIP